MVIIMSKENISYLDNMLALYGNRVFSIRNAPADAVYILGVVADRFLEIHFQCIVKRIEKKYALNIENGLLIKSKKIHGSASKLKI